ncbi:Cilia- and flagella-associated protein 100 [Hondaea fermentalgiana]|uniref:Cilia-and flagella-associated protein 100 n=1 Tax=Hondaea fermentalgiana TaxID=2315210 RepID=A0A2R5FZR6_9STRA|nr:Cilia- and flagella-associated protein 100 [Hondaea fermentalgiana]|eukprot:GBG24256.1 Cilia- and flagella-associated protein 100 [Hondaea fermentalgiana]
MDDEDGPRDNPFRMPSDDQVFLLRERERKLKQDKRERLQRMSVWEKTLESTKRATGGTSRVSRRELDRELSPRGGSELARSNGGGNRLVATGKLVSNQGAGIALERRHEKDNMADFIAKKREMFLVQMSLDTKREEIRKLEEKAQLKEEALRKSELMLEEDAIRFDTFLKENDKKAHEAIKRAETETKLKQDKVQEIKKLNHQIQAVQSEMSKLKEQLDDCLKYKAFLDELTPAEWFAHHDAVRRRRKKKRRAIFKAAKLREYEEEKQRLVAEHDDLKRKEDARNAGRSRGVRKDMTSNVPPLRLPDPPVFDFSDDEGDDQAASAATHGAKSRSRASLEEESKVSHSESKSSWAESVLAETEEDMEEDFETLEDLRAQEAADSELPMYFTDPQQLLNIFTQLEESNLFLIQNSQETESALEELKQEFRDTKLKMDSKTDALKGNIQELKLQIGSEEAKASILRARMDSNLGEDAQEKLLSELNAKVKEVYRKCGFDCDASPSTLSMLTDLEARLEELLAKIEQMPEDYVVKAEKLKEKERRERVRAERLSQQQRVYEERLRKSIERSMQAPKKKTGKPVMFRSAPPQKKERKKDNSAAESAARDLQEFLSW